MRVHPLIAYPTKWCKSLETVIAEEPWFRSSPGLTCATPRAPPTPAIGNWCFCQFKEHIPAVKLHEMVKSRRNILRISQYRIVYHYYMFFLMDKIKESTRINAINPRFPIRMFYEMEAKLVERPLGLTRIQIQSEATTLLWRGNYTPSSLFQLMTQHYGQERLMSQEHSSCLWWEQRHWGRWTDSKELPWRHIAHLSFCL